MIQSWKARKMVPGKDTLSVMAMHYGLTPKKVRDIIKKAGVPVIREDGFRGTLTMVVDKVTDAGPTVGKVGWKVPGWSDGQAGVDLDTTKLTKSAIMAVSRWTHEHSSDVAA